jgi:hypothetical protein
MTIPLSVPIKSVPAEFTVSTRFAESLELEGLEVCEEFSPQFAKNNPTNMNNPKVLIFTKIITAKYTLFCGI